VVPPLLVFGAPVTLAARALPRRPQAVVDGAAYDDDSRSAVECVPSLTGASIPLR
jgi:hypothetical protein